MNILHILTYVSAILGVLYCWCVIVLSEYDGKSMKDIVASLLLKSAFSLGCTVAVIGCALEIYNQVLKL